MSSKLKLGELRHWLAGGDVEGLPDRALDGGAQASPSSEERVLERTGRGGCKYSIVMRGEDLNAKLKFGEHRDKMLHQIPTRYLRWMRGQDFPSELMAIVELFTRPTTRRKWKLYDNQR